MKIFPVVWLRHKLRLLWHVGSQLQIFVLWSLGLNNLHMKQWGILRPQFLIEEFDYHLEKPSWLQPLLMHFYMECNKFGQSLSHHQ